MFIFLNSRTPLTHEQIIEEQNLAEFSNVSHTAVYLLDKLSKLGKGGTSTFFILQEKLGIFNVKSLKPTVLYFF